MQTYIIEKYRSMPVLKQERYIVDFYVSEKEYSCDIFDEICKELKLRYSVACGSPPGYFYISFLYENYDPNNQDVIGRCITEFLEQKKE